MAVLLPGTAKLRAAARICQRPCLRFADRPAAGLARAAALPYYHWHNRALEEVLTVAKMVRCKVCGYVMPEGKLRDKCPACGVAAKAFEPWEDPLSEQRRRALALDLHPIAVHFPTAFVVSLIVIFVVGLAFRGGAAELFLCAGRL